MGTVRQRRRSKHGAMASSSRKSKRKVAERRYKTKTGMSESGKKSWDDRLTVDELYGRMGLASKANAKRTHKVKVSAQVEPLEKKGL